MPPRSPSAVLTLAIVAALTACASPEHRSVADDAPDPDPDAAVDHDAAPPPVGDAGDTADAGPAPTADAAAPDAPDLSSLRPPDVGFVCDPGDPDTDGDGTADACDVCPALPDADQADTDGDGLGDACDPTPACIPGARGYAPCGPGNAGTQTRTCDATGAWLPFGECAVDAACDAGDERIEACGVNRRGLTSQRCVDGRWAPWNTCYDPDDCRDGTAGALDCGGLPESREALCVYGQWEAQEVCDGAYECVPGSTRTTACPGGQQVFDCQRGRWRAVSDCVAGLDGCETGTGPLVLTPGQHTVTVDTTGLASLYAASCGGGASGPETAVHLRVPNTSDVVVRVVASTTTPVLHVIRHCRFPDPEGDAPDDPVEAACSDTDTLTLRLTRGEHVLLVDAPTPEAAGATTLEFEVEAVPCTDTAAEVEPAEPGARVCVNGVWSPWEANPLKGCASAGAPGPAIPVDPELALCRFCADAAEPNDTLGYAAPLAFDRTAEDLTLCPVLDRRDDFALDVPGPGLVTLEATADVPARGAWGPALVTGLEPVAGVFVLDARGPIFVGYTERADRYYARVDGRGLEAPLAYALHASFSPSIACEHGAGADCVPCLDADEAEPRALALGAVMRDAGLCQGLDAHDAYTFTPPSAGRYRATLTVRRQQGEFEMRFVDALGRALSEGAVIDGDRVSVEAELGAEPVRLEVDLRFGEVAYDLEVTGP